MRTQTNQFGQEIPDLAEALPEAAEYRRRIHREFDRLHELHQKTESYALARKRLRTLFLGEYLGLVQSIQLIERAVLIDARDTLEARLWKGADFPLEDQRAKPAKWLGLLAEYEVLCDALEPTVTGPFLDRLARKEYPETQQNGL